MALSMKQIKQSIAAHSPMSKIQESLTANGSIYRGTAFALGDKPENWAEEAHMNWEIKETPVLYRTESGKLYSDQSRTLLYRSDDEEPLATVSTRFKIVQPAQIVSFFGELSKRFGFKLELAGQGSGGKKIWGLASTNLAFGKGDERIENYLMLTTANDGTMSTKGFFTAFRLFCTNQLPLLSENANNVIRSSGSIGRVSHSREFSTDRMASQIDGLSDKWKEFETTVNKLANTKVSDAVAKNLLLKLQFKSDDELPQWDELRPNAVPVRMFDTYKNDDTNRAIAGTAWGLVNGVTRYLDHGGKANNGEARIDRVWLGSGKQLKETAFNMALELVKN